MSKLPKEVSEAIRVLMAEGYEDGKECTSDDSPQTKAALRALESSILAYGAAAREGALREAGIEGLTLPTQRVLRYLSWERADELHHLAQPLVDHVVAGKLAKNVCDLLLPGTLLALAAPRPASEREDLLPSGRCPSCHARPESCACPSPAPAGEADLRAAGAAVVEAYADCRARGSFAGFWTHVDDLSKALELAPCPICDGPTESPESAEVPRG